MASPSELSLDYMPNSYPSIQKPLGDQIEQTHKLEDFLARLKEEKLKIEAFKRELPLCMQLLNNAVETYSCQLETYQTNNQVPNPVLEEFIPMTNKRINGTEKSVTTEDEKANWMVSAQLWSPSSDHQTKQQALNTKLALDTKQRNGGGAFLPFSKENINKKVPDLGHSSVEKATVEEKKSLEINNDGVVTKSVISHEQQGKGVSNNNTTSDGQGGGGHRKARRCWSPDLHRRFVNALQMLGGSQVATPKQIRELMKVDGLTNDEVKSHLQKYRLHTRRPIQPPPTSAPQLVVLGSIWVPPEYATSATTTAVGQAIYGAPTHYSFPHDFYASPQPPPHHHHHHFHAPTIIPYKARVQSPDSGLRSGRDCSESIEEGRECEEREADEEEEEQGEGGEESVGDEEVKVDAMDHDDGNKVLGPIENNGLTLA